MASDIEEAIKEMILGDLEGATMMSPIDYAKRRGIYPQQVYKALRDKRLNPTTCECGRKVVVVDEADRLFKLGEYAAKPAVQATEEVSGSDVDTDDEVSGQA